MQKIQIIIKFFCFFCLIIFSTACKKDKDETVAGDAPDPVIAAFVSEINADTLKSYVQWMQNYESRFFLKENRKQIATDIKNKFLQLGYPDTRLDSFYLSAEWGGTNYNTWQYNVIARLPGNTSAENVYITGAHYDCVVDAGDPFTSAPGANDNASGIAGLIEIARVLKKKSFIPKNTIEFVAFAAEEYELNGSSDYVNKAYSSGTNIIMMLNNDMISYETEIDPASWTLNVMDYDNSSDLRTMFVKCGTTYTKLKFSHNNQYNADGDSYSFYSKGYKSVFIISDKEDTYYHTANDIISNYNFNYCKEVVSVSCALLLQENK
jgi:hypothetical protein